MGMISKYCGNFEVEHFEDWSGDIRITSYDITGYTISTSIEIIQQTLRPVLNDHISFAFITPDIEITGVRSDTSQGSIMCSFIGLIMLLADKRRYELTLEINNMSLRNLHTKYKIIADEI